MPGASRALIFINRKSDSYFFPKCTDCFFTFVSRMLFFTVGSVGYLGFVNWFFTDPVLFTKCCFSSDFSKFLHIVLNTILFYFLLLKR